MKGFPEFERFFKVESFGYQMKKLLSLYKIPIFCIELFLLLMDWGLSMHFYQNQFDLLHIPFKEQKVHPLC
jgi:hypothetical protein